MEKKESSILYQINHYIRDEPHIDFRTHCVIMTQRKWPLIPPRNDTTSKQTTPDYWSTTATMLVIFWTEQDFCTLSDCSNSTTNSKTYEQVKISLIQQIRSLHLKKPLRKNVKRLLVCVSFSLGSIYKY